MNIVNFCLCKPSVNMNSSLGLPVTEDCRTFNLLSQQGPPLRTFLQETGQSLLEIILERSVVEIQLWLAPENKDKH
jgi:hypothetical protein